MERRLTMKGKIETSLGEVIINPDVIATYAGSVAVEKTDVIPTV